MRIHSDQGQMFESKLVKELCEIARVEKSRTTLYHPVGKSDLKMHVPTLVHAFNATFHDSSGYSPDFLMFSRHPRSAINAFFGLSPDALSAFS